MQDFQGMMVECEKRYLAPLTKLMMLQCCKASTARWWGAGNKVYDAFRVAGLLLHDGGRGRSDAGPRATKLMLLCVAGLPLHDGGWGGAVAGQERQSLCCFCVAGLPLHDGVGGGVVPGQE